MYAVFDIIKRNTSNVIEYEVYKIPYYELISQNKKKIIIISVSPQNL